MRVLIACEYSGTVRDAFIAKGHDAVSCDILPTDSPGPHIQGDVLEVLGDGWDLMIAHPPCTYISFAGTAWWNQEGRWKLRLEGLEFFGRLWDAPIEKICLENPKSCASPVIAKYTQEIQPFYFGDSAYKTTWLWLKNLPPLVHTKRDTLFEVATAVAPPEAIYIGKNGKKFHHTDAFSATADRAKLRAKFWPGIAQAMADQWG